MDTLWYKNAVIYELYVKGFFDSTNNGRGDLAGLTQKLDYLAELGVDCVWLLPIFPSPGRDDGYDIQDYYSIHPEYGTLDEFKELVEKAHSKGLKIMTELVLNHTSDQHPWFQEALKGKDNPYHDFYVWADHPNQYKEARIIFTDTEKSNWTWNPVVNRYFWHRFFSHQPDLNFDNPKVREEMLRVMRFWLDLGVDGLRADAVPYLFEREGTNCENLPETHAYIKEIRKVIDAEYPGRILLAEANQWPEDLLPYFGDGDEFHMAFNFPLMPRIFMAFKRKHHGPIVDIMKHLPAIPDNCQWAIFLRNHDELSLEMVTDEERDYMYSEYAKDRQMRINVGIRRRLAPLLDNNRKVIELAHALLLTLPGTPVLYYGDEIGMGDNIYLGDRNGVRTPMHWDSNTNAGFSGAKPSQLYAPVILDPEYNYEAVNVASSLSSPSSLYHFVKRLLAARRTTTVFGSGTLEFLYPENKSILVFLRSHNGHTFLCAFNLADTCQAAEIGLQAYAGKTPTELLHGNTFPRVGELPYLLTFTPYAFYVFELR